MTKVADQTLAKYIKFQHDMLERVLKGSIDPIELMNVQRELIGQKKNSYLRLISGNEIITIPACKGGEKANIYHAKETFPGYIGNPFLQYGCDTKQSATEETNVKVYETYDKDADLKTLFSSLNSDLKSLAFESQEQIVKFCELNKKWIKKSSSSTFFLFTEMINNEKTFFVANIGFYSGKLEAGLNDFSDGRMWPGPGAFRFVVPATKTLESKS